MNDNEILERIVVEVSRDKKEGSGTGFYISADKIATCYHVLVPEGKKPKRNGIYWIRNDSRDKKAWQKATLVKSRPLPDDIAVLKTEKRLDLFGPELLRPWDKKTCAFLSRGYTEVVGDDNIADFYATQIGGEIKADIWIYEEKSRRLQLDTPREAIKPGRSGSPVLSLSQKAIVGMIDYQGGELHKGAQIGAAIPIEAIVDFEDNSEGPLFYVPSLPLYFIPRNPDLEKAKTAVLSEKGISAAITGTYRSVGLQGMGGIGKSVLAAALARDREVRRFFKDGIVWIKLGQDAQQAELVQGQINLIRAIDPEHGPIADIASGRTEIERVLSRKRCLIILDDVWRMEQIWAFDCPGPACRLLLTTHDREIVRNSGAEEFRLGVLSAEESLELLRLWSGKKDLPPEAAEVAKECDNLPLALAMVGAMVKGRPDDRWENVLHRLRTADLQKIRAEFRDYPYPNLMKAIEISTDGLAADQKRRYFDLAAFPEDEQVPEAALRVLWNLDRYDTQELIDLFVDRSLAELKDGRLSVHDLQHDFMIKRAGDLLMIHQGLLGRYKERCSNGWPSGPNDGYFFQHLAYHLSQAQRSEEIRSLLLDFDWIEAKLQATDVPSLLSDYDRADSDEDLSLIQGAIELSAHVLFRDPEQLPGQLTGRLVGIKIPSLESLIMQIPNRITYPWLRPLSGSLASPGGPLIRTLQGHTSGVGAVAISQNGKQAISGSFDRTLKLWDLEKGQEIRTLEGHANWVRAVAISQNDKQAISGSFDRTLKIWDLEKGQEIRTLEGHAGGVGAVAISQDGRRAISGSFDRTLKIWDLEKGQAIKTLRGHTDWVRAVAISQDGRRTISGSDDNTLKIWDLEKGREIRTLEGYTGRVETVAIFQDGRRAISGSLDRTLKLWDLEKGQEIRTLEGHTVWVESVAISQDGSRAISRSFDGTLRLWDLEEGQEIRTLEGHTGRVGAVAISQDGRRAISGSSGRTLRLWDLEKGREIGTLKGHTDGVSAVAISQDGRRAISGSFDNTLRLWDLETGRILAEFSGEGSIMAIALSRDGQRMVAGDASGRVHLLALENSPK